MISAVAGENVDQALRAGTPFQALLALSRRELDTRRLEQIVARERPGAADACDDGYRVELGRAEVLGLEPSAAPVRRHDAPHAAVRAVRAVRDRGMRRWESGRSPALPSRTTCCRPSARDSLRRRSTPRLLRGWECAMGGSGSFANQSLPAGQYSVLPRVRSEKKYGCEIQASGSTVPSDRDARGSRARPGCSVIFCATSAGPLSCRSRLVRCARRAA